MMSSVYLDSLQVHGTGVTNYFLKNFKGLGTPSPRVNRKDRARRHGAYDLTTYYGPRIFSGELWVQGDTNSDWASFWVAWDVLMEELGYGTPTKTLTFTRTGQAYSEFCSVKVEEEVEPTFPNPNVPLCWVPLELVAADPRIYATDISTVNFASSGNAANGGNFNTPPLIVFNGGGTDPGIINNSLSTENELNIDYAMGGGDTIEVDMMARTVKLNGALRPDILVPSTSHFFSLRKGSNSLSKQGGASSIDVFWYDSRIG